MDLAPANAITDDELAGRARGGNRSAFEQLIARHDRPLAAWLFRQVRKSADAEDVLQEVLLKAWRAAATYQGGNYRAWLFQVARSCLADWGRKSRRHDARNLEDAPEPVDRMGHQGEAVSDHAAAMEHCLGKLDEKARTLVRARFGGEDDLPVVCERLGIEKKTAQNLVSLALNRLRECVERRSGE